MLDVTKCYCTKSEFLPEENQWEPAHKCANCDFFEWLAEYIHQQFDEWYPEHQDYMDANRPVPGDDDDDLPF